MLLCIMLYIMLAYLMLLNALFNAVCLYIAYSMPLTFSNAFCFHVLSLVIFLFFYFFLRFFQWKGYVLSGEIALKNIQY